MDILEPLWIAQEVTNNNNLPLSTEDTTLRQLSVPYQQPLRILLTKIVI